MSELKRQIEQASAAHEQQRLAAAALANARIMRNGSPPISNVLDALPQKLRDQVMEDAEAALEAAGAKELLAACKAARPYLADSIRSGALPAGQDDSHYGDRKALELIDAAVAKAEGRRA